MSRLLACKPTAFRIINQPCKALLCINQTFLRISVQKLKVQGTKAFSLRLRQVSTFWAINHRIHQERMAHKDSKLLEARVWDRSKTSYNCIRSSLISNCRRIQLKTSSHQRCDSSHHSHKWNNCLDCRRLENHAGKASLENLTPKWTPQWTQINKVVAHASPALLSASNMNIRIWGRL